MWIFINMLKVSNWSYSVFRTHDSHGLHYWERKQSHSHASLLNSCALCGIFIFIIISTTGNLLQSGIENPFPVYKIPLILWLEYSSLVPGFIYKTKAWCIKISTTTKNRYFLTPQDISVLYFWTDQLYFISSLGQVISFIVERDWWYIIISSF